MKLSGTLDLDPTIFKPIFADQHGKKQPNRGFGHQRPASSTANGASLREYNTQCDLVKQGSGKETCLNCPYPECKEISDKVATRGPKPGASYKKRMK